MTKNLNSPPVTLNENVKLVNKTERVELHLSDENRLSTHTTLVAQTNDVRRRESTATCEPSYEQQLVDQKEAEVAVGSERFTLEPFPPPRSPCGDVWYAQSTAPSLDSAVDGLTKLNRLLMTMEKQRELRQQYTSLKRRCAYIEEMKELLAYRNTILLSACTVKGSKKVIADRKISETTVRRMRLEKYV